MKAQSLRVASLMVFLTGAAALVYELAWTRWLTLVLGASAEGLAVVTASTMLGFAIGAGLLGRRIDTAARPLRAYGVLEVAVGLSAALVSWALHDAGTAAWSASLPRPALVALVLAMVGLPTAFMGVTLPAVVAYVGRRATADTRGGLSTLYAANTAGAVVGTLAAGFALIELFGYGRAAAAAIALNLAVGLAAIVLDRDATTVETAPSEHADAPVAAAPSRAAAHDALLAAGVSGFGVMAHEVLSSRLLVYGFFATSHAIAIILAVYLAGLSLGARAVAGPLRRGDVRPWHLGLALITAGGMTLAFAPSLTQTSALVDALRGNRVEWSVRIGVEAAVAAALLLPSAVSMGLVFPLATALGAAARAPGATIGRAVLVNTLAGAVGALGAGFVLVPLLGVRGAVALVSLVQAVAGAWIVSRHAPARRGLGWIAAALLALGAGLWSQRPQTGAEPGVSTLVAQHVVGHEREYRVLCYREGPTAITEVLEHLPTGRRDLLIDGFVATGTADTASYMRLMGTLPMALHPAPRRALVICFGTGTTARAVASFPDAAVDIVDLNPDVFRCAPALSPRNPALLARASVHVADGRAFLRESTARFDVITQEPMPPHFAGVASLYSAEYYRLARARLADDGVMVQWLPMHLTAPADARQIAAAALAVFPETWMVITPNDFTGLLVMSPRPIPAERRRAVDARLSTVFALDPAHLRRFIDGAAPITDDRPTLEYNGIDRVLGRFRSSSNLLRYNLSRVSAAMGPAATP